MSGASANQQVRERLSMPGTNSSQDPDYEGPVGHEKKTHKTHFGVVRTLKGTRVQDDPNWYEYAPGKWRRISTPKERVNDGRQDS
jgi:hypothetical protein